MAKCLLIDSEGVKEILLKAFQSANLNFMIGSGASFPAIKPTSNVEKDVTELFSKNNNHEAYKKLSTFLRCVQRPNNIILNDFSSFGDCEQEIQNIKVTIENYGKFIRLIEQILSKRRNNLLPKQANIFTTNYDLFIEKAAEKLTLLRFNDGFARGVNINKTYFFSSKEFFNSTYNNGNLYNYEVQVPSINLIKIHGSLSWKKENENIVFEPRAIEQEINENLSEDELKEYINKFAIIVPQKGKFRETIMDRTYYDLLRIYANELDKENTLLISFGFSFEDEHILDISKRALKNPTLILAIFAHSEDNKEKYLEKFDNYNNVIVVVPQRDKKTDFQSFNKVLENIFNVPLNKESKNSA